MKLTTLICGAYLIAFGIGACVYALTGFSPLAFVCFGNALAERALLSLTGVAAGWLAFWLIAFRPHAALS